MEYQIPDFFLIFVSLCSFMSPGCIPIFRTCVQVYLVIYLLSSRFSPSFHVLWLISWKVIISQRSLPMIITPYVTFYIPKCANSWQSVYFHLIRSSTLYFYSGGHTFKKMCMTGFGKIRLIACLVKIDFLPEKTSTKFNYCLSKIWALYVALF